MLGESPITVWPPAPNRSATIRGRHGHGRAGIPAAGGFATIAGTALGSEAVTTAVSNATAANDVIA